jgi:hypothetical protein
VQLRILVRPILLVMAAFCVIANAQSHAEYVGGTAAQLGTGSGGSLEVKDDHFFAFYSKKAQVRVPYDQINLIEYGQQVNRRIAMAIVISPLILLSKSRKHFLTVGYADAAGRQQALVFRIEKGDIRATLVSLEARTGLKVQYQDEEARKSGKG